jgi:hypothetical protein
MRIARKRSTKIRIEAVAPRSSYLILKKPPACATPTVEHVHVNDGGQAVIGNVKKQDAQD